MDEVSVLIMGLDRDGWPVASHFRHCPRDQVDAHCTVWLMQDKRLNEVRAYPVELETGLGADQEPLFVTGLPWEK